MADTAPSNSAALADSAHVLFPAIAVLLLVCVIWVAWRRYASRHAANLPTKPAGPSAGRSGKSSIPSYRKSPIDPRLLTACLGDRKQAKRLLRYELRKNPYLSEKAAVDAALARLRRDNH
jgi:hypothetical protein